MKIEGLPTLTFEKIYWTLLDIEDKAYAYSGGAIRLPFHSNHAEKDFFNQNAKNNRLDALSFLKKHGILDVDDDTSGEFNSLPGGISRYHSPDDTKIYLNWDNFMALKKKMKAIYDKEHGDGKGGWLESLYPIKDGKRLDENIALLGSSLLLHEKKKGVFSKKVALEALAAKLLHYLINLKNHCASIQELRGYMKFATTHQIYHQKDHINKVCADNGIKMEIIISISRGQWGLNPDLTEINKKVNVSNY